MSFYKKLENIWKKSNSLLCVGLDPDLQTIEEYFDDNENKVFNFNKRIIDSTYDLVCCYKPQVAYYSAYGLEKELELTINYIKDKHPDIVIILDAKRNDIGQTCKMYAKVEVFERYNVDAVTVNPYMGSDSIIPFIEYKNKGTIVLCKTSNSSSSEIQNLKIDNEDIYKKVLKLSKNQWNKNNNIALVIGATYPKEMKDVRDMSDDIPFLVPGIGIQGGSIKDVVKNGINSKGTGLMISSSRAVIYASKNCSFDTEARRIALEYKNEINLYRK